MSSETVSHNPKRSEVGQALREASTDSERYVDRVRQLRRQEAEQLVRAELIRRAALRVSTPAERWLRRITYLALAGAVLSAIITVIGAIWTP